MVLNPTSGPSGTSVTAALSGFKSAQSVTLYWDTTSGVVLTTVTTSANGSATANFAVPAAPSGSHAVVAQGSGGPSTSANFGVT
jgi:hypothetical protein